MKLLIGLLFLALNLSGQTIINYQLAGDTLGNIFIVKTEQTFTKVPSKSEGLKMLLEMKQDALRWQAQLDNMSAEFLKPDEPKLKKN